MNPANHDTLDHAIQESFQWKIGCKYIFETQEADNAKLQHIIRLDKLLETSPVSLMNMLTV